MKLKPSPIFGSSSDGLQIRDIFSIVYSPNEEALLTPKVVDSEVTSVHSSHKCPGFLLEPTERSCRLRGTCYRTEIELSVYTL